MSDEQIPDDVVHEGITREFLQRYSAAWSSGRAHYLEEPGEMVWTDDPVGVGPTRKTPVSLARFLITCAQADDLGVTDGELPGIHIIDTPEAEEDHHDDEQ